MLYAVYPLGIPLLFFVLLLRQNKAASQDIVRRESRSPTQTLSRTSSVSQKRPSSASFSGKVEAMQQNRGLLDFLTEGYRRDSYYFVLADIIHKLFLVSAFCSIVTMSHARVVHADIARGLLPFQGSASRCHGVLYGIHHRLVTGWLLCTIMFQLLCRRGLMFE